MATIFINDASIEYMEKGEGEPVVFVHGSVSDYRTWEAQYNYFSPHYRTITYSRRFHWPNKPIEEDIDYLMRAHVDDLMAVLRLLDATPAHLVGHSYGAFICLLLAIKEPKLVRSLILAEPPVITLFISNSPKPTEILKLLINKPRTAITIINFGMRGIGPATAAVRKNNMDKALRIFGTASLGKKTFQHLTEARLEQVRANLIKAEFLGSGFAPLEADQVRNVQTPALLLNGEQSPALFHRLTEQLRRLLPNNEYIKISKASHIMHEDNASDFNDEVLSFLYKHQKAT